MSFATCYKLQLLTALFQNCFNNLQQFRTNSASTTCRWHKIFRGKNTSTKFCHTKCHCMYCGDESYIAVSSTDLRSPCMCCTYRSFHGSDILPCICFIYFHHILAYHIVSSFWQATLSYATLRSNIVRMLESLWHVIIACTFDRGIAKD